MNKGLLYLVFLIVTTVTVTNSVIFIHSFPPLQGFLLGEVPRQPRGNKLSTDTLNSPSKLPQNRFKPLRGILHHPDPRNALRTA